MTAAPDRKSIRANLKAAGLLPSLKTNPDAELIVLIQLHRAARVRRDAAYKRWTNTVGAGKKVAGDEFRSAADASMALENRIAETPAKTPEGAMAKLLLAMEDMPGGTPGSCNYLPVSAMLDVIAVGA